MTELSERAIDATGASADRPAGTDEDPVIAVRDLTKTFGSGADAVTAVDGVSFAAPAGTVVGLLGPNGAGKTTIIKSVLGLVVPDGGTVEIAGVDVAGEPRRAYRHVGAMLEGARNVYWKLTVRENLAFFAAVGGASPSALRERHDDLLDKLGLADRADAPVNELSRGMKQKVSLACALARDVDVVFLDEPTLGLDVESSVELRREIRRLAEEEDVTVILSSHDMDVVEDVCDRVVIVNDGEIIADDAVADLVDVFRAHAYRITLDGALADAARERLRSRFDASAFDVRGDHVVFDVVLERPERFYGLMDVLRETGRPVVSVESIAGDLEELFLEITDADATPGDVSTDRFGGETL